MPLVASRYHSVALMGPFLGPPLVVLTSIALIAGFLTLLTAAICPPLVPLFAWPVRWSLAGCEGLVSWADRLPGSCWYVGDVPEWWLWVFYVALLGALMFEPLYRQRRWAAMGLAGWLCVGLLTGWGPSAPPELRCTFLAVGHGGCTVLETPDGRVLLYDAGAMAGPDVTRRQIAPFLWSRGIRRIDEVFLSHADLDHFNGLPSLLERFAVGQVTCTPTFRYKQTPAVAKTLEALEKHRIPVRIAWQGDIFSAGTLEMEVLHPPEWSREGNENARSLVLLLRHAGHRILLTGDLESPGLERVLSKPALPVDVLMAPHHGSRFPNTPTLAKWARPRVTVACQGPPRGKSPVPALYRQHGAWYLGTWPHGAVTIRSRAGELTVETFATGQRLSIASGIN
jgi:competence protein ComEC